MDAEKKEKLKKALKFDWKKDIWWFFFVVAVVFATWAYIRDTRECRELIAELQEDPCRYCNPDTCIAQPGQQEEWWPELPNFTIDQS